MADNDTESDHGNLTKNAALRVAQADAASKARGHSTEPVHNAILWLKDWTPQLDVFRNLREKTEDANDAIGSYRAPVTQDAKPVLEAGPTTPTPRGRGPGSSAQPVPV